jgi:hypothetical protein
MRYHNAMAALKIEDTYIMAESWFNDMYYCLINYVLIMDPLPRVDLVEGGCLVRTITCLSYCVDTDLLIVLFLIVLIVPINSFLIVLIV